MSILLQVGSRGGTSQEATTATHFEVRSWAKPAPPFEVRHAEERARIKAFLLERRYRQIADARLSHIPLQLPFPKAAIIQKLKENDRSSPNWEAQEQLADLEAELALTYRAISASRDDARDRGDPKLRRLESIWKFLGLSAQRFNHIWSQRIGRLNFNFGLFFRSDVPSHYIVEMGESTHWELAALAIVGNAEVARLVERMGDQAADQLTHDEFLQTKASLRDIEAAYRDYTKRTRKITTLSDKVLEWRDALEYYVDLFSADGLADFRQPRQIYASGLDPDVLSHLSVGLHGAVLELRQALAYGYPSELVDFRWLTPDESFLSVMVQSEVEAT